MGGVTDPRQSCVAMSVCGPIESEVPEEEEEPVVMEMDQEDNVGVNRNICVSFENLVQHFFMGLEEKGVRVEYWL